MKKILLTLVSTIVAAVLMCLTGHIPAKKTVIVHAPGESDDVGDYYKWELKRLADPATGKIPANIRNIELAYAATLPSDMSLSNERFMASATWNQRGPWNVGGRTRSFAADVKNEGTLLAGTTSGGMWRSTDTGRSWSLVTPLAIQQGVCCLTQDMRASHSNIWYYGSGEAYGASASASGAYFSGNGVYRSKDNGLTWTVLPATSPSKDGYWTAMWNVAADSSQPDSLSVVYAATLGAIYRSADTGNTWKVVLGHASNYSYFTDVAVTPSGVVYATLSSTGYDLSGVWQDSLSGAQSGIWRSTDGVTFTNITPPNFPHEYNRVVIGISPKDENQVYFLVNNVNSGMPDTNFLKQVEWDGLFKYKYLSGNGSGAGGSWFDLTNNLPSRGGLFDKFNCQGSYDMVVQFLPNDTATVFIGGTDIFRSATGFFDTAHTAHIGGYNVGASLPAITVYPNHHPDQHVIFFSNSNPNVMYSGCDGGVFRTMNDTAASVAWNTLDSGYVTTMFYTVASDHTRSGGQVLIGGAQDNNSLFDNSPMLTKNWTKPVFGDGAFCYIEDTGKVFYYSSEQGKMFKAQMDTTTGVMTAFRRIDPIGGKNYEFVNPFVIDPNDNNIMYLAGGKYLWRDSNLAAIPFSNQWDSISTNWMHFTDSVPRAGSMITAVAVSTVPANRVYYGTDYQRVYRVDNANTGSPTPKDITGTTAPNAFPGGYVSSIAVDPLNADHVIVTFSNYNTQSVFYSSNGGTSWLREGGNLTKGTGPSIRWAALQHVSSGRTIYWVGSSTGLYATDTLLGTSTVWVQQGAATIGNAVCDYVDVRPVDGLVAIATHAHGIYTSNITNISAIASVDNIDPVVSGIWMNVYPNPVADRATITYNIPADEYVQLRIFDMQGRLIKEYPGARVPGGQYNVYFDSGNLPGGVYLCALQAGNEVKTIRMAVIK